MLGHSIVSPAFHGTRRFNTEFTRALHLFLSLARPIQSTSPHPTSPRSVLILHCVGRMQIFVTATCSECTEEKRNAYRLLVRKPEGKGPLGRPRRRWVDNIRMDFGEVGWGDVD
jgi:hypothetical protein